MLARVTALNLRLTEHGEGKEDQKRLHGEVLSVELFYDNFLKGEAMGETDFYLLSMVEEE